MEELFAAGRYDEVITRLGVEGRPSLREEAILGVSLLRLGRFGEAEPWLLQANLRGEPEAMVEYGNLLRVTGRLTEARQHLEFVLPALEGELRLRAERWLGVSEYQAGLTEDGLKRTESAWHGYLRAGDELGAAKVAQALAQMYGRAGQSGRALQLLQRTVSALPEQPNPLPRLSALQTLLDLQIEGGVLDEAHDTVELAERALAFTSSARPRALLLTSKATLRHLAGEYGEYAATLDELGALSARLGDRELSLWTTVRLAEHQSLMGRHGQALGTLLAFPLDGEDEPPEIVAARGVLARRRRDFATAADYLGRAAELFRGTRRAAELTRVQLQLAYVHHLRRDHDAARDVLRACLEGLLRLHLQVRFRPELEELSELLHFASLEPDLEPYLAPVLEGAAAVVGAPAPDMFAPEQRLVVHTLGYEDVLVDGVPAHLWGGHVAVLVYIALHPGVSRADIGDALVPDLDPEAATAFVKHALRRLRDTLGANVVVTEGPRKRATYRLGHRVAMDLDLSRLYQALGEGRVEAALACYRGDFLPSMLESEWVDQTRSRAQLALGLHLGTQLHQAKASGDWPRALLLAQQWLRVDPHNIEAARERVLAARHAATPEDYAQYQSELLALER